MNQTVIAASPFFFFIKKLHKERFTLRCARLVWIQDQRRIRGGQGGSGGGNVSIMEEEKDWERKII